LGQLFRGGTWGYKTKKKRKNTRIKRSQKRGHQVIIPNPKLRGKRKRLGESKKDKRRSGQVPWNATNKRERFDPYLKITLGRPLWNQEPT